VVSGRSQSYAKTANRPGSGTTFGGIREITSDDIWTQPQRELFKQINDKREQLETLGKLKQLRTDELSILIDDLVKTGMKKSRVAKIFRMAPSLIGDLVVRSETARALLGMVDDQI
jgi:DNA-directed RNA polymerase subunit F